jgi:hypothetical protein
MSYVHNIGVVFDNRRPVFNSPPVRSPNVGDKENIIVETGIEMIVLDVFPIVSRDDDSMFLALPTRY